VFFDDQVGGLPPIWSFPDWRFIVMRRVLVALSLVLLGFSLGCSGDPTGSTRSAAIGGNAGAPPAAKGNAAVAEPIKAPGGR